VTTETLKDAALFQRPKVEVLGQGQDRYAQILLQLVDLAHPPCKLEGRQVSLASAKELLAHPPSLEFEQMSLIIVDDTTIISIRPDVDQRESLCSVGGRTGCFAVAI